MPTQSQSVCPSGREERAMACPTCRLSQLVEISVRMGDRNLTMRSCSRCEGRWWDSDGERLDLPGVLGLAARR